MAEQATTSPTSPQNPQQPEQQHQTESTHENFMYKNHLQEFAQRANLPLPVYHTTNRGLQHAPQFSSTVVVDGKTFTSSTTFSNRKAAEQDAAKVAFEGISMMIKDCISNRSGEGFPPIYEDSVLCKSILHEFAAKMNLKSPIYNTVRMDGPVAVFVSYVDFNGVTYTGDFSSNKKKAEQFAARAVILSLLGNYGAETLLPEIIKSKAKFFSAVHKHSCPNADASGFPLESNSGCDFEGFVSKERVSQETGVPEVKQNTESALEGQSPGVPCREFTAPIESQVSQSNLQPTSFVRAPLVLPSLNGLTCGVKRKCKKKKKKANKKVKSETLMQVSSLPMSQVPSLTIA